MKRRWKRIKDTVSGICVVDWVLMLFMAVLLFCMAFHLFDGASVSQDSSTIDIIVRTSASAIFGYFISGNFLKTGSSVSVQNSDSAPKAEEKPIENPSTSFVCCSQIQVIVVSIIGMISLILLLVARNFADMTPEFAATVSQFRDFVAACVGFLVSCGKKR